MPDHALQLVEAAINESKQAERLIPFKEKLPDEIGFNMIRCMLKTKN